MRLRVVSPRQSGFNFIGQRSGGRAQPLVEDGLKTLRFRPAGGAAVVEATASSGPSKELLVKINEVRPLLSRKRPQVFETYLGVQDEQLALAVWEEAERAENLLEMSARVRQVRPKEEDEVAVGAERLRLPRRAHLRPLRPRRRRAPPSRLRQPLKQHPYG